METEPVGDYPMTRHTVALLTWALTLVAVSIFGGPTSLDSSDGPTSPTTTVERHLGLGRLGSSPPRTSGVMPVAKPGEPGSSHEDVTAGRDRHFARVAQQAERPVCARNVAGSIPASGSGLCRCEFCEPSNSGELSVRGPRQTHEPEKGRHFATAARLEDVRSHIHGAVPGQSRENCEGVASSSLAGGAYYSINSRAGLRILRHPECANRESGVRLT